MGVLGEGCQKEQARAEREQQLKDSSSPRESKEGGQRQRKGWLRGPEEMAIERVSQRGQPARKGRGEATCKGGNPQECY